MPHAMAIYRRPVYAKIVIVEEQRSLGASTSTLLEGEDGQIRDCWDADAEKNF